MKWLPSGYVKISYLKWPIYSWLIPSKDVFSHSYVSLPEGILSSIYGLLNPVTIPGMHIQAGQFYFLCVFAPHGLSSSKQQMARPALSICTTNEGRKRFAFKIWLWLKQRTPTNPNKATIVADCSIHPCYLLWVQGSRLTTCRCTRRE